MPTSIGEGLKTFTTTKIRITRKGIYTNPQVLKIPKIPLNRPPIPPNLLFVLKNKNTSLNDKCRHSTQCTTLPLFPSAPL